MKAIDDFVLLDATAQAELVRNKEVKPIELPGTQREAEKVASFLYTTALSQQIGHQITHYQLPCQSIDPVKGDIVLAPEATTC